MRSNPLIAGLQTLVVVAIATTSVAVAQQAPPYRGPVQQANPAPRPAPIGLRPRSEVAPPNGQPGAPAPQAGPPVGRPFIPPEFQLTPDEHAALQLVLRAWEKNSASVENMSSDFWLFETSTGLDGKETKRKHVGKVRYVGPDKGTFIAEEQREGPPPIGPDGKAIPPNTIHWVCDGKAIYEFRHATQQVVEQPLPPELQGKAITEGPLPFFFGAKADMLERRYFLRISTPPNTKGQIWIKVAPKYQADAANFNTVEIVLDEATLNVTAMEQTLQNGKTTNKYLFYNTVINSRFAKLKDFFKQSDDTATPSGWKRIVEEPPLAAQPTVPPPQAQRQPAGRSQR